LVEYQEGTVKEERMIKRQQYIIRSLADSPKRWSELKNELYMKNRWFRSTHDLSNILDRLEKKGVIKRIKVSHKNVRYFLTENFEQLQQIQNEVNERWKQLPALLREISEHPEPRKVTFMKTNDLILRALINYLDGVEVAVRAPSNLRSYARWLLARLTDEFGLILVACGKRDGDATDFVLQMIKDMLYSQMYARTD